MQVSVLCTSMKWSLPVRIVARIRIIIVKFELNELQHCTTKKTQTSKKGARNYKQKMAHATLCGQLSNR